MSRHSINASFSHQIFKIIASAGKWREFVRAMQIGERFALTVENDPYMPLHMEYIGRSMGNNPLLAVSHTFIQNGDLMRDPEMIFEVQMGERTVSWNHKDPNKLWIYEYEWHQALDFIPVSYRQDPGYNREMPVRRNADGRIIAYCRDSFVNLWGKNLGNQGFAEKAMNESGTEIISAAQEKLLKHVKESGELIGTTAAKNFVKTCGLIAFLGEVDGKKRWELTCKGQWSLDLYYVTKVPRAIKDRYEINKTDIDPSTKKETCVA
jgi:hypothetical protein